MVSLEKDRVLPSLAEEAVTMDGLLRDRARHMPDRQAYVFLMDGEVEADRLTWSDLDRQARAVARELCRCCAPGDRALLLYPPGLDFIAAFFGCLYAGVVAVPAYPPRPRRDQPRLRAIVLDACPRVALTTPSLLAGIGEVLAREPALAELRWLAIAREPGEAAAPEGMDRPSHPEAPAFLQYTSGSTALPKGVVVSHANLLHNERTIHTAFGLDESSVVVSWLPLYHDMGLIGTVLQPLYCGGCCVLMSPTAFLQRPRRWLEAISRYRGTASGGPNFAYELCVRKIGPAEREGLDLASWTVAFNGAEPVRADTLERFAAAFAPSGFARQAFLPCYGLAESTLFVSGSRPGEGARTAAVSAAALARHEVAADEGESALRLVSCGRPAAEQRLIIVDPESRAEHPPDRVGEIWISGPSVARAYWGQTEVSARELGASLADGSGSFLRTGDLGFLRDGELYVTGRRKDLIILRGRNHYPQDLELTAERAHRALIPGAGAAFSLDAEWEERLVLVSEVDRHTLSALPVEEVAAAVRQALAAEHEVRLSELVLLRQGSLPRTSSGKVQRHACRDLYLHGGLLVVGRSGEGLAADTETNTQEAEDAAEPGERIEPVERFLLAALARVIRVDPARIDRGLAMSSYGLDSLAAVELHNAIEAEFGAAPSVAELLEGITLAAAARGVAARSAGISLEIEGRTTGEPAGDPGWHPLTQGQQALWSLYELAPASAAYNIAGAARLSGVSPAVLGHAFQTLVDRHPSLRTTYANGPLGPVQRIGAPGVAVLVHEDATEWGEEELLQRVCEAAFQPFDLEAGPVLRGTLFDRRAADAADSVLVLAVHHIAADFWSLAVLVRELGRLCSADESTLPALSQPSRISAVEIALGERQRQAAGHYDGMLAAARRQLAGAPPLDLGDRPRPKLQTYAGGLRSRRLGPELDGGLRALARRHDATLFMVLLAGFEALLARSGGQDDFAVGTPTSGRSSRELEGVVGYLVNPVALRADLSSDPDVTTLLARSRRAALDAFARQDLPFPLLAQDLAAERDPSRPPVFQAMLTLQRAPEPGLAPLVAFALGEGGARLQTGSLVLESVALEPPSSQVDLTLLAGELQADLAAALQFNSDLFDGATAERMLGHLASLLAAMVRDDTLRLSELAMLSPAEAHQLLFEWNATAAATPAVCLQELIEAQVERTPEAPAVACGEETLTYRTLSDRAASLARHLERLGVGPEVRVGVCLERSTELMVSLLATLKAGGAFVPIDPSYPAERLAFMLEDSRAAVVLTQERLAGGLPVPAERLVLVDAESRGWGGAGAAARKHPGSPDHLAYVLYTSGSTGRPKGAMNSHRAIVNRLCWMQKAFPLSAADRVLQKTPASFDVSVWEFFWPLMTGACLVMARPGGHLDPTYLRDEIAARGITTIHFVPSLLQIFLDQPGLATCASLHRVLVSGEALSRDLAARFQASLGTLGIELHNLYGPTEAAVDVTWWPCPAAGGDTRPVPIGRPIDNTRVVLLDRDLRPVPIGVAGELCIGGVQVARGYLGRPALTAERFIPDPSSGFSSPLGGRLYRTGDLVRHRPGGELEFLGRIDHQVKVRGVRIELGEIEVALAAHAAVREAVVLVRGEAGKARLAAYVVPAAGMKGKPGAAELRAHLQALLPEALIPGAWIFLPALPLSPSGKVDRKALPEPDGELIATAFVAPRTAAEEALAAIWSHVLERDGIGVHDNFFELGGHSLLATRVISQVRNVFRVEIGLRDLFAKPTVAGLAERLEEALRGGTGPGAPAIERVPREGNLPLSFAQQRLWFIHQLDPKSPVHNMATSLLLEGELDVVSLELALTDVVCRHEALRTRFPADGGLAMQRIDPPVRQVLPVIDLLALKPAARLDEARRLAREEAVRPFDLARGPLLRGALVRHAQDTWSLLFALHHIVSDGWSIGVMVREISVLYRAHLEGLEAALPDLPIQYADYAAWQRSWLSGEVLASTLDHWRRRLAGAPPVLSLPLDRPRSTLQSTRGALRPLTLGPDLSAQVRAVARQEVATLFMTLLAAFQCLLARLSGQNDIVVGTPIAGRNRLEIEGLIGFFINTLALRSDLSGSPTFAELLQGVRATTLDAYAHQDLPFERLVEELAPERSLGHAPLFQVVLGLQNAPAEPFALPGLRMKPVPDGEVTAEFDWTFDFREVARDIAGNLHYRTDLFDGSTIDRVLRCFRTLLAGAMEAPELRLGDLPLLGAAERHQLLGEWSTSGLGSEGTIGALFAAQVDRSPQAVAVVCGGERLSYGDLEERSNRLARHLARLGVGPEVLVGLCVERSVEMVVGLLGILKAGGAYVPLDPHYPAERLALLIEDTLLPVVVGQERWLSELPVRGLTQLVALDTEWDRIAVQSGERLELEVSPESLAYVMYTSGSTGRPKGVGAVHRGVVRLVRETGFARFGPEEVFLQLAPLSFDASTLEIWGALLHGGRLVVAPPGAPSLGDLGSWIAAEGVTTLWLTAGLFHEMVERELSSLRPLRQLLVGGDVVQPSSVRRALADLPGLRLINGYGPTENTTFTACHGMSEAWEVGSSVWIGRPIAGTEAYVVDMEGSPSAVGVWGELLAGGLGLARGYVNRPDLTAERWVPDVLSGGWGRRLYRTGDLVRWRAAGTLEFLGRADRQVKVRGYRIEPGEVESALLEDGRVREAVVVVREEGGDKRLAAYVVLEPDRNLTLGQMREHLGSRLPEAMVPTALVVLESLPLTVNGKVDRAALPAPESMGLESSSGWLAARTPVEEILAAIWSEVLGVERVGIADNFFDLGGHSLLATRVISQLRSTFQVELGLHELFEEPTVVGLASRVEEALRGGLGVEAPPVEAVGREGELPLSFAQQRLWFIDQLESGSPLYNVPIALRARGELAVAVLARTFQEIVLRHEALRTVFSGEGGRPRQVILAPAGFSIPLVDLSSLAPERREAVAAGCLAAEAVRPFDLAQGPLLRVGLWRLGETEHLMLIAMHHIVCDGWSLGVLLREVRALYTAFSAGRPSPLPELPVQYADFAAWQRSSLSGEVLERELAYWRERLAGAPPVLELPTDRPRPAVQSPRGAVHRFALSPALSDGLLALGRREGATLFMALLAAFGALLSRLTGQADLTLGTVVAGRNRLEIEDLVGFFVNTLVLRPDLSADPSFTELLRRARGETLRAYTHQDLPFEKLVEELAPKRSLAHTPLFQVMLVLQNAEVGTLALPGLGLEPRDLLEDIAKFDLSLVFAQGDDGIGGALSYSVDLFDAVSIARLAGQIERLLAGAMEAPELRLGDLPLLGAAERHQLLGEWSTSGLGSEGTIGALFAAQVDRSPQAVAMVCGGERLSYGDLEERSNRLARHLARLGVGPEVLVGLCVERSVEMVVGLLGILKAGGAYVPLDPRYPAERLALLIEDTLLPVVVGQERWLSELPVRGLTRLVALDTEWDRIAVQSGERLEIEVSPESLVYVMYTSGSTGRPKGVGAVHRGVVRLVRETGFARFGPEEVFLQLAPLSFDASTLEIWGALLHGGRLVVAPPGAPSLGDLGSWIAAEGVTTLWLTAGLFHEMVERELSSLRPLRQLLVGGDVVQPSSVRRALAALPGLRLINGYGPTENTTFTACHGMSEAWEVGSSVWIGRPIAGTEAYVVDMEGHPSAVGVWGELLAGGSGLARGYVNRPDLAAERWVPDALSGGWGRRLYRTGDLVRWRAAGTLEFLGRADRQVKVRGYRIEPGEVESALLEDGRVREAVVVVREEGGDKRLAAYVVLEPDQSLTLGQMREHLGSRLPEAMVPTALVVLESLPLTANGKVDRTALPAPESMGLESSSGWLAARTPVEEILAAIWSEVLGVERVGIADNFFDLGGHSLLATRVISQLRSTFQVELGLHELFEEPTVVGLASRVEEALRGGLCVEAPPVEAVGREGELPLSFAQQRLWLIDQLESGSPLYNVPIALRARGELSVAVLARTFQEIVRRHEALRTVFSGEGGRPRQVILAPAGFSIPLVDLSSLAPERREPAAADCLAAEAVRPFDLAQGPLLRVGLWRLGETEHLMLLVMHHIVSDGWSLGVLVREVTALYPAFSLGSQSPLAELPLQYADFAAWQRSSLSEEVLDGELAWWREHLSGAPPMLELPTDRPRPAVRSRRGGMLPLAFDPELSAALSRLAQQQVATLFMVLLAAFQSLLGRLTGAPEVCVGTPIAGRTRRETEDLIGFFVNTLVMRGDLSGDPAFVGHLARVRREALAAYAHQELPFEKLVGELGPERRLSATPLFQVLLALQNAPMGPVELPSMKLVPLVVESGLTRFDLEVSFSETAAGLTAVVRYAVDLFDRTTVARLLGQMESLLRSAVASPERRLSDLALLTAQESQQVLVEWRGVSGGSPAVLVPVWLSEQASRTPQAVAVVWGQERLSYGELDRRVDRLARRLRGLGVRAETRVGLLVERSLDLVVGLLAIWRAGGAAVPLDPGQPRARLALLVADALARTAGGAVLVAQHGLVDLLADLPLEGVPVAWVDADAEENAAEEESMAVPVGARDLAYLIYTSGTTGRPKAVMIEHGSLAHTLAAVQEMFGFTATDRMPVLASASFDIFLFELLAPLLAGGTAVLFDLQPTLDLALLAEELRSSTLLHAVPAVMRQLTARVLSQGVEPARLRQVFAGGDAVGAELLESMRRAFPRSRLTVLYGPTEGTILASAEEGEPRPGSGLGWPLPGVTVTVRDGEGAAVSIGVAGELWLGGPGVARGYLGRPELTAERFVPDPEGLGGRLYRTGDRVRFAATGRLEFLGRVDQQVKVRGFRIEPGEVEATLLAHPGVREAVVLAKRLGEDERLVAYVVAESPLASTELRRFVEARLPSQMVPGRFVFLPTLPLTRHGKVDRRALLELVGEPAGGESSPASEALRTPFEELVAGLFAEVLHAERVGPQGDFFELGGHSLLATQLASRLREVSGVELPLRTFFEQPKVADLALWVEEAVRSGVGPAAPAVPAIGRVPREGDLPLSFAQQRLWFIDQMEGGSVYNMPVALRMSGELSVAVLARVLAEVVHRHEALRTVFPGVGGQARQVILPPSGFAIPVVDLASLPPALREPAAMGRITEEARRPFDLAQGPLLRAGLWRLEETEHLLLLCLHHIVSDGWSMGVLVREVTALYPAFAAGLPSPLPELPAQYADFAAWQRSWLAGEVLDRELHFWRERLAGAPPVFELPTDRPRPAVQSFRGAARPLSLRPELSAALTALSRRQGATLFMTLVSAWSVLLSRLAGQPDFTLGTVVAGRHRLEVESLIGFFVNTLVLRPDLSAEPRFTELLSRVRREALDAYAHQDLPFEKLVEHLAPERSLAHTPLFQVTFAWQNAALGDLSLPGLRLVPLELQDEFAKFDLSLTLQRVGGRIEGALSYAWDLFDAPTIDRLAAAFSILLAAVVEDPALPIAQLSLLGPGERHQLVVEWNATGTRWPSDSTLPELFALQAAAHPQQLAWEYGGEELSYKELASRSGAVARFLIQEEVRAGDVVGVCFERSGALLVSMLGILKAGAAYLPLDPGYPRERLAWMLEDSGAPLLLTQESLAGRLPPSRVVRLDAQWDEISAAVGDPPGASPADPAYVIYTSGSTGRPKGVAVPHRAVVRLVMATDYVELGADQTRIAQLSNLSFDAATFEIWGALLCGATLVGVPQETLLAPADLAAFLAAARIRVLFLTTALFNQVAQQVPGAFGTLHAVLFGGEAVDPGAVRKVLSSGGPERLLHVYGPTENTTFSTCYRVEDVASNALTVPIGRPIANTRAYVLDAGLQPVALGGVGELYLGGEGLALGYWRNPERTAERFVESPALPGERLYRTGDLARCLPDGNLEFRGRGDQQIKLRGFRIELGEIELALTALAEIVEAAVVLRDDLPGGRGLMAYVVGRAMGDGGADLSVATLRQALKDKLPDYMVPAHFVPIAALPLTPNGKVDRKNLMERGTGLLAGGASRASKVAPRTPAEELLAGIFAAVLGIDNVGAEADFFALGGHSLLATQLVSRVRSVFGIELPVRTVFEAPTVAGLASLIESSMRGDERSSAPALAPIARVSREEPLDLSFAQQRLWFLDQLEPGSPLYNVPLAVELRGSLDVGILAAVLGEIVRRHEVLRTRFAAGPVQVIDAAAPLTLAVVDLSGLPEPESRREGERLAGEEARRPFDLVRGPLLRTRLLRRGEGDWALLLSLHHIVSDGWSLGVLIREVGALYTAFLEGRPSPLPELAIQYADFAAGQRRDLSGERLEAELSWWRERLAGMPAALELPTDHRRPAVLGVAGAVRHFVIPRETGLADFSRRHGATLFMTLLGGFLSLLQRWTGGDDLVVGTPIAGRTREEIEPLIGLFVNTLALRTDMTGEPDFLTLLGRARETAFAAYAHQEVPFERLVEELAPQRDGSRPPLVQVLLVVQNAPEGPLELPGLALTPAAVDLGTAKFELTCAFTETARGLEGALEYNRDLFTGSTLDRFADHFVRLLASAVADPRRRVAELPLLSAAEQEQLLVEWSGETTAYPRDATIHALFAAQADARPDAVAVEGPAEAITYGALRRRAGRWARRLRAAGVGPEVRVGVCLDRSPDRVMVTLAVLEAGGVYVPLDPSYPPERLAYLVRDSAASVLIGEEGRLPDLPQTGAALLFLDRDDRPVDTEPGEPWREAELPASRLAYVIYTSGSTGEPKGAAVPHRAVVRLVRETGYARFGPDEVFLQLAPYAFDASTFEMWGALLNGGRLMMPPPGVPSPTELGELLGRYGVTALWLTAGLFHQMVEENLPGLAGVRQLLAGGDVLLVPAVRRMLAELPGTRLINGYGPTENTTFTCCHTVMDAAALEPSVPLGRPIANTRVYVLDRALQAMPVGVPGELFAAGDGLARGYLGRPERTAERFLPDPFGPEAGGRLYRTGDLVRWRPVGALEFLGRMDAQVKVRGFRVEPGEIEAALAAHSWVRQAVVLAQPEASGGASLVAYVAGAEAGAPEPSALRNFLGDRLPGFMLPSAWVLLPELPLTANGKVDRKALAKLRPERALAPAEAVPRTPAEELVAGIFAEVLRLERVEIGEDFFALGGHSLLATRVVSRVRSVFGVEIPVRAVFEAPTAAGLASLVERSAESASRSAVPPLVRVSREKPLVLSFAQQRLWFLDQLDPGNPVYNIPVAVELAGRLDVAALAAALGEVVRRHEALRTTFRLVAGEPVQVIAAHAAPALPLIDLAGLPDPLCEPEVCRLAAEEARRPFALGGQSGSGEGSLLRAALLRTGSGRHVTLLTVHHIVSDGWSMDVLVRELGALYTELAAGRPSPLPQLEIQYADFAAWQREWLRGEAFDRQLAYWTRHLAGAPPVLSLPFDRPRPARPGHRGATHRLDIPPEVTAPLKALGRSEGTTLFMTLLAAWSILLHRYSGQPDIVVGSNISNRRLLSLEGLIGLFANTVALRIDLAGAPTVRELLARVREVALGAHTHQDFPFEKLVEALSPVRDAAYHPVFQVMLVMQEARPKPSEMTGLTLRLLEMESQSAKLDLTLYAIEEAGGIAMALEYDADLFAAGTIGDLAGQLAVLLESLPASIDEPVSNLRLVSAAEEGSLVGAFAEDLEL